MSLIPTWPIAAGALVVGLAAGGFGAKLWYADTIADMKIAAADVERQRAEIYAADQLAARAKERGWADRVGQVEQEKQNAQAQALAAGAAARNSDSMRQRAERRNPPTGGVSEAAPACAGTTGVELSRPDATFLIGIAQRSDEQRAALAACYGAYDALK